ncbi:DNA integrity scanning diadenylate cyclase DisA [bacterium]|nr:DNA integrity scanning diadenylate cyclase DisA [bacterium]
MVDQAFKTWEKDLKNYYALIEKDKKFQKVLQMVAPGTPLRKGIDFIVQAEIGGLIVIGAPIQKNIMEIGFEVIAPFTPNRLYEISKMDGAVILSKNIDSILYSNVHLHPSINIPSMETGTRHKVAARFAKETGLYVIAVSKKRNTVTIYSEGIIYSLKYIPELLAEVSQAISTFDHYANTFNNLMKELTFSEIKENTTLHDIIKGTMNFLYLKKILNIIKRNVTELGAAAHILRMRIDELTHDLAEGYQLVNDYITDEYFPKQNQIFDILDMFARFDYIEPLNIINILGYSNNLNELNKSVVPRGYRILSNIPKLPDNIIENIINKFRNLQKIIAATQKELVEVEGVGDVRATSIREGILNLKNRVI